MTYILFYVTAKDCPACTVFRPQWDTLYASLKKVWGDRLEIETIAYEKRTASALDTSKYPVDLMRYIAWYPTFILVSKDAYLEAKARTRLLLPAHVFNGVMPPESGARVAALKGKDRQPLNVTTLQTWVERVLTSAPPALVHEDVVPDVCTRLHLVSRFARPPA